MENKIIKHINRHNVLTAANLIEKYYKIKPNLAYSVARMCWTLGKQLDEAMDLIIRNDFGNCFEGA